MHPDLLQLDFAVHTAIRYHAKMRRFFGSIYRIITMLILVGGTAVFADLAASLGDSAGRRVALVASAVVAFVGILEVTVGFSERARIHNDLYRRFSDLLVAIMRTPANATESEIRDLRARHLQIGVDEPTPNNVLSVICHNEEVESRGLDLKYLHRVFWFQRLFAYVIDIPPNNFPSLEEHKKENAVLPQMVTREIVFRSDGDV